MYTETDELIDALKNSENGVFGYAYLSDERLAIELETLQDLYRQVHSMEELSIKKRIEAVQKEIEARKEFEQTRMQRKWVFFS